MFNVFKERSKGSKGSGLDTPPASALQPQLTGDLRLICDLRFKKFKKFKKFNGFKSSKGSRVQEVQEVQGFNAFKGFKSFVYCLQVFCLESLRNSKVQCVQNIQVIKCDVNY